MKEIEFLAGCLSDLRAWPDDSRREAGYELNNVQRGLDPRDWKPMPSIGVGIREIRIHVGGEF